VAGCYVNIPRSNLQLTRTISININMQIVHMLKHSDEVHSALQTYSCKILHQVI